MIEWVTPKLKIIKIIQAHATRHVSLILSTYESDMPVIS